MGADDNPDVLQHRIPCLLLTPAINAIIPGQKPALYRTKMICDDSMLLLCKCHSRTKKPDKLLRLSVYKPSKGYYMFVPALGHSAQVRPPNEVWRF